MKSLIKLANRFERKLKLAQLKPATDFASRLNWFTASLKNLEVADPVKGSKYLEWYIPQLNKFTDWVNANGNGEQIQQVDELQDKVQVLRQKFKTNMPVNNEF